jgi:hypothetical protein
LTAQRGAQRGAVPFAFPVREAVYRGHGLHPDHPEHGNSKIEGGGGEQIRLLSR